MSFSMFHMTIQHWVNTRHAYLHSDTELAAKIAIAMSICGSRDETSPSLCWSKGILTYLLNSGSFSRSNRAECVVIFDGLNSEISSFILRPIRWPRKQMKQKNELILKYSPNEITGTCIFVVSISPSRLSSLTAESRPTVGCNVQQGLWKDSVSLEALDENVPLSFGKFAAIFVHQKREMSKGGRLPSKSTVHQEVFGGGDEPLWPP